MGFFANLFGKNKQEEHEVAQIAVAPKPVYNEIDTDYVLKGLTDEVEDAAEKELVSVIAASILAGNQPDSEFRVKRILRVNEDRKRAVLITAAIASNDAPNSQFRLHKVEEI